MLQQVLRSSTNQARSNPCSNFEELCLRPSGCFLRQQSESPVGLGKISIKYYHRVAASVKYAELPVSILYITIGSTVIHRAERNQLPHPKLGASWVLGPERLPKFICRIIFQRRTRQTTHNHAESSVTRSKLGNALLVWSIYQDYLVLHAY